MSWNMDASKRAYEVHAMIRTCICANDTNFNADEMFGGENGSGNGVGWTLQIAERFMSDLIEMKRWRWNGARPRGRQHERPGPSIEGVPGHGQRARRHSRARLRSRPVRVRPSQRQQSEQHGDHRHRQLDARRFSELDGFRDAEWKALGGAIGRGEAQEAETQAASGGEETEKNPA